MGPPDLADRLLANRYRLCDLIGRGGMGMVWRAEDTVLQRAVAVKEVEFPVHLSNEDRASLRARVLREARAAARINHPTAVTVFDVVEEDGRPFIVMELVPAPSLGQLVQSQGPLSPSRAALVGIELLGALEAAHAVGIVHRDVKPDNVLVPEHGRVRLTDFGIAFIKDDPRITRTGLLVGSPAYMAPEQAESHGSGAASDLWSLGATLYFSVEGEPPFDRGHALATLAAVVQEEPRPPRRAGPLAPVLAALLVKDPARRVTGPSLRRMLEEVAGVSSALPPAPSAPSAPSAPAEGGGAGATPTVTLAPPRQPPGVPEATRPTRPRRRSRARAGIATVSLLVAAVGLGLPALRSDPRPSSEEETGGATTTTQPTSGSTSTSVPSTSVPTTVPATTPPATAAPSVDGTVPGDWVAYNDPARGFRLSHPPGWQVRITGRLTDFRDPASGSYLRVDWTDRPGPSPAGAWEEFEKGFSQRQPGYRRIRITPTTFKGFPAAEWEFTYGRPDARRHAIDLGFLTGSYGFALNFQTREQDWEGARPVFEALKSSFVPPG